MVRHCVLFRFTAATTAEDVERIRTAAAALPGQVPSIRAYTFGPDLRLGEGSWDFAIIGDFADADGWAAYDEHPDHLRFRHEVIGPHVADRAAVRIEV
jgi:hypothetical protein